LSCIFLRNADSFFSLFPPEVRDFLKFSNPHNNFFYFCAYVRRIYISKVKRSCLTVSLRPRKPHFPLIFPIKSLY
jgi:hypothetical protein